MTGGDGVTLFLCGDVMTGRGVDQILPHPGGAHLYESSVRDARQYVALAEAHSGRVPAPVAPEYIWGDALAELSRVGPDARVINLETSVTSSDDYWRGKGINYRMHPENVACLTAARSDVCGLANNHVLDYGYEGLVETLDVLSRAGLKTAGAGRTLAQARAPAVVPLRDGASVAVFAVADGSSGVPAEWGARDDRPGVDRLPDLSDATVAALARRIDRLRAPRPIVLASIHWGSNWGYDVPREHVRFARRLVDVGVDIVHGHSSHHPRPIEVYRDRLILYGCGDFVNDYEGIEGHERYRSDLVVMYFVTVDAGSGALAVVRLSPMRTKKLQVVRAAGADAAWVREALDRISTPFGVRVDPGPDGQLSVRWSGEDGRHHPR
ncbi:MAG TPA: CapA family protein [Vicinamibacterales bacterium]|nr:CapA family protein [Vicinamibacterales bacterium]